MEEALQKLMGLVAEVEATSDLIERGRLATEAASFAKDQLMPALSAERQKAIDVMHDDGKSLAKIGAAMGISTSRAHQLVKFP